MIGEVRNNNSIWIKNSLKGNGSNSVDPLERAKANLEKNIQSISKDNQLSDEEKRNKINDLEKQIDDLSIKISEKKLDDIKKKSEEVVEKAMEKNAENSKDDEVKAQSASVALNYGLISAASNNNGIRKLSQYRKKAVREDGEDSARVSRIDKMISEKTKDAKKDLNLIKKAIEKYSKEKKNEKAHLKSHHLVDKGVSNNNQNIKDTSVDKIVEVEVKDNTEKAEIKKIDVKK